MYSQPACFPQSVERLCVAPRRHLDIIPYMDGLPDSQPACRGSRQRSWVEVVSGAAECLEAAMSNKQNGERVEGWGRVWVRAEGRETASKVREVPGGGHGTVPGHAD
ncbi:hypothetical protein E2C01_091943 [Portunus trituberculatus]|uniref:Uncharacterized protein n=1 Tax=Portunus trituberculatus TaxID=210409 RepID=A0A5B7JKD1_PORTR|nr:hypothetical protein [Portunus trituberculatus]